MESQAESAAAPQISAKAMRDCLLGKQLSLLDPATCRIQTNECWEVVVADSMEHIGEEEQNELKARLVCMYASVQPCPGRLCRQR